MIKQKEKKKKSSVIETLRDQGIVIMGQIAYYNTRESWFGVTPTVYQYKVTRIPETSYSTWETLYNGQKVSEGHPADLAQHADILWSDSYGKLSRMVRKRAGIYMKFGQTGLLGIFNINNLLSQIVSGMGLLAAGATLCELLAFYVLPNRKKLADVLVDQVHETAISEIDSQKTKAHAS